MRRVNPTPARAGMTLIELLVVMAIIATLAALILSAVFAVRDSQMKSFTETLVQKLGSALDQQVKATMDQAREEWAGLPSATLNPFLALGNNDPRVAKVIYVKARLAQEFPATFAQAINPMPGMSSMPAYLTGKPAYAGLTTSTGDPNVDMSVLLALSLSQSRRGMSAFSLEQIEPTALRTVTVNGKTYTYFVDSWGTALRYYVFPYLNDELNGLPYFDITTPQNQQSQDPQDPDQALKGYMNAVFNTSIHPTNYPTNMGLRYMIPVVVSAGRDQDFGDQLAGNQPTPLSIRWMYLPNPGANDNICSYRLRQFGRRGD